MEIKFDCQFMLTLFFFLLSGHNRLADYSATVVLACTHVGERGVGTVTGVYICSEALDMKVSMVSAWTVLSGSSFQSLMVRGRNEYC